MGVVGAGVRMLVVVAFSSLARILGQCWTTYSLPALIIYLFIHSFIDLSLLCVCAFFKGQISSRTQTPLFMPESVNSGSAG